MGVECQLTPNGDVLLTGGTQKALSRKEMTKRSEWPVILCSNGNFLVLVDKCMPFCQKGVWDKSRSGTWPDAKCSGFLPNVKNPVGRRFLKLS